MQINMYKYCASNYFIYWCETLFYNFAFNMASIPFGFMFGVHDGFYRYSIVG